MYLELNQVYEYLMLVVALSLRNVLNILFDIESIAVALDILYQVSTLHIYLSQGIL